MSTLSLRLPESLHVKVKELAERDDISINQFIATAVAEKMAALLTLDYLEERAKRGSRAAFERALAKVPDRPPLPGDELPEAVEPNTIKRDAVKRAHSVGGERALRPKRSKRGAAG